MVNGAGRRCSTADQAAQASMDDPEADILTGS
jgi:hypothetical protein